jgi:hypothetical protein
LIFKKNGSAALSLLQLHLAQLTSPLKKNIFFVFLHMNKNGLEAFLIVDVPGEVGGWLGLVGRAVQVDNVPGRVVATST